MTWPIVEVIWHDAHGGDEGWTKLTPDHAKPAEIRTVGMLARENKRGVVVVLSHDSVGKVFGGYVFIPAQNIIKLVRLHDTD